jgi:uncharacterized protein (TIGR03790 family)
MPRARALVPSILLAALAVTAAPPARAGGGPVNVVVAYSADDPAATAVAQHYAAVRALPPGHACGLTGLTPAQTTIDVATFKSLILAPLDACMLALPHPDEVDYLVLVRGLPYSVTLPSYAVSLQALLQVRHATLTAGGMELAGQGQPMAMQASVPNPLYPPGFFDAADSPIMNQYASWYSGAGAIIRAAKQPAAFHAATAPDAGGYHFGGNLLIVSALDGFDYTDATALVDRAAASDGTFPTADLLCMRGEDDARSARDPECELATRMLTGAGLHGAFVDPFDGALAGHTVAAYFTGSSDSVKNAIAGNTFVPGAIADNLTSYGAAIQNFSCTPDGMTCPASEAQTSVARFVRAGATGAHGTVNEPLNNPFPNAGAYLLYTFGYSMGESFFFNQRFLYWQNVYLGDPLATPYGARPVVTLDGGASHPQGQPITVHATHPDGVSRVDLFSAGKRVAQASADTLTWTVDAPQGTSLDLLAVAVAANAPVMRPGWPKPAQQPRPDVQGWTHETVTVSAPLPPTGSGGAGGNVGVGGSAASGSGGGTVGTKSGCGVGATGEPGPAGMIAAAILAGAARRRRSKGRAGAWK